jgi:hypothetical protein
MEEKLRFVFSYERDQQSMTDRCLEFGVSRETGACVAAPLPAVWGQASVGAASLQTGVLPQPFYVTYSSSSTLTRSTRLTG